MDFSILIICITSTVTFYHALSPNRTYNHHHHLYYLYHINNHIQSLICSQQRILNYHQSTCVQRFVAVKRFPAWGHHSYWVRKHCLSLVQLTMIEMMIMIVMVMMIKMMVEMMIMMVMMMNMMVMIDMMMMLLMMIIEMMMMMVMMTMAMMMVMTMILIS